jgi:hypothetical protein
VLLFQVQEFWEFQELQSLVVIHQPFRRVLLFLVFREFLEFLELHWLVVIRFCNVGNLFMHHFL